MLTEVEYLGKEVVDKRDDWSSKIVKFEVLKGKIFSEVIAFKDEATVWFITDSNYYCLYHRQDCCESFILQDIAGDIADLNNSEIKFAEEVQSSDPIPGYNECDSFTWTFYKLSSIKGDITFRFIGESNGYYSETADLFVIPREVKHLSTIDENNY